MSSRVRYFRDADQAKITREFLNAHNIKNFIRERTPSTVAAGEVAHGFDIFILRDEDLADAWKLLSYEFGGLWGEATRWGRFAVCSVAARPFLNLYKKSKRCTASVGQGHSRKVVKLAQ